MKDVDVGIVTGASATTGDDGLWKQVWLAGNKKVAFDIATDKDTFFGSKNAYGRNSSKLPIIDMPFSFDPFVEAGPSRQHGTLWQFFESCLSLERDPDALVELETLFHLPNKIVKDSAMNSLKKEEDL